MAHSVSYSRSLNSDISRGSSSNKNNYRKASPRPKQLESREAERQRRQSEFRTKEAEQRRIDEKNRQRNQAKRDRLTESRLDNDRGRNVDLEA